MKQYRDLEYFANGHDRQKLNLFVPEGSGPFPTLIWVHGGAWRFGDRSWCLPLQQGFMERGYAIASVEYRLTTDAIFPAQIEDCKAAVRWLRAQAKDYDLDVDHFGAWGDSAGGHLVALLGTSGEVQAVCDYYGPTDLVQFVSTPGYESHQDANSPESQLLGGVVLDNSEKAARANPVTYINENTSPFLIVHGDKDPVVPLNQSESLYAALTKAGIDAELQVIPGAGHGGPEFVDKALLDKIDAFFARHLKREA